MGLHDLTALEQASAIRTREISAVELTRHYLERAHRLNESVGAYALLCDDLALEQAAAADRAVAQAEDPSRLPVLHGVVVPVKDLNQTAGVLTRFGTTVLELVPTTDDDVVAAMRSGGTVLLGKTTTPEFGLPCYTESDIGPHARTPWDLTRGAGGSSGGAAVAVAAGLAAVAQGSDGGGSIRIPASCCGLVGLKPTRGLISNGPLPDGPGRLAVMGPLARTVADAAALLGVMAERDDTYVRMLDADVPSLVIGRCGIPVVADTVPDPEVLAAWEDTCLLLESMGHRLVDLDVPVSIDQIPVFERVWAAGAARIPLNDAQVAGLRPLTRWLRERGLALAAHEVEEAARLMEEASHRALRATAHVDIVITPTLAQLPAPVGGLRDDDDPAGDFEMQKAFTPYTAPYNMTGQPAVSLPVHWTAAGLPVGVQLVGRPHREAQLLALSARIEHARPWASRHPEVW